MAKQRVRNGHIYFWFDRWPHMRLVKRKPTASLASYDIELLKVWYRALKECTSESLVLRSCGTFELISEVQEKTDLLLSLRS